MNEMLRGRGCWKRFDWPLEGVYQAAKEWKAQAKGVEKPWLCWHVSDAWTRIQVNLVKHFGWTPIVGYDPDCGTVSCPRIEDALVIDFNKSFHFNKMSMHFPLEFAHLWVDRLAFWHSDLLVKKALMSKTVSLFEKIKDGEIAGVPNYGKGRLDFLSVRKHRIWELIGLTTAGASEDQYSRGTGWWRHFWLHPNCPSDFERSRRSRYYYDHGTGIMYWHRKYGGKIHKLNVKEFHEGHCTSIGNPDYVKIRMEPGRLMLGKQLELNYNLELYAKKMGLEAFL